MDDLFVYYSSTQLFFLKGQIKGFKGCSRGFLDIFGASKEESQAFEAGYWDGLFWR